MQSAQRSGRPDVIERLLAEPHSFRCTQAVRLLLRWLRRHGVSYEQAYADVLRFDNSLSLSFPASEIAELKMEPGGDNANSLPRRIRITPAFIGLLGANGALPLHVTQGIAAMPAGEAEASTRAFFDMYSGRMVALFHQAWGKHRLEYTLDTQGRDTQLPLLLALSGARHLARDGEQHAAAYYAGLLRSRPVNADSIGRVLAGHFCLPVKLEQLAGSWDYLREGCRSTLGRTQPSLGHGAVLGKRIWRHDRQVRLDIGPLNAAQLERFLPHGEGAAALLRMLKLLGAPSLRYEVRLILARSCIRPVVLGARRRLGWDSFLPSRDGTVSKPEVRYLLQP
ncbi:type VI secretion system baseplate subunit TssG [Pseudoduganella sp. LjRoot289]|uniref:type VI secretion system baseplate subunit TssG n=1 Tax=Pseudoduganella sp. LjRoot289 TaxID=3342314 RepID=UPI003ECCCEF7